MASIFMQNYESATSDLIDCSIKSVEGGKKIRQTTQYVNMYFHARNNHFLTSKRVRIIGQWSEMKCGGSQNNNLDSV